MLSRIMWWLVLVLRGRCWVRGYKGERGGGVCEEGEGIMCMKKCKKKCWVDLDQDLGEP
jgi:hypothetical protein